MQPITILSTIEIVFIIWFGAQLLIPTFLAKEHDDDDAS